MLCPPCSPHTAGFLIVNIQHVGIGAPPKFGVDSVTLNTPE